MMTDTSWSSNTRGEGGGGHNVSIASSTSSASPSMRGNRKLISGSQPHHHHHPPTRPTKPSINKQEEEIVRGIEELYSQMVTGGHSKAVPLQTLQFCLRTIGSQVVVPERATDEFRTLAQMKKKIGKEQDSASYIQRLDELYSQLKSPALAGLLKKRWAVLYLLSRLARPEKGEEQVYAGPALDCLAAPDFPSDQLLHPHRDGIDDAIATSTSTASSFTSTMDTSISMSSSGRRGGAAGRRGGSSDDLSTNGGGGGGQQQNQSLVLDTSVVESTAALSLNEDLQLLRDCLYLFQGINGQYVRYEPTTGSHVIDPQLHISTSKKDVVLHCAEMGWLFRRVSAFADRANRLGDNVCLNDRSHRLGDHMGVDRGQGVRDMGLVGQALSFVLQDELTEYYALIAVLEGQLNEQGLGANGTISSSSGGGMAGLTLRRLAVWIEEPLNRIRLVATLCDSIDHVRGGAMASVLFQHSKQGDGMARQVVQRILGRVCVPIFEMIRRWILEGDLVDTYGEFFVLVNEEMKDIDERLWHHKYSLRRAMLPKFIPEDLAQKILVIGKSINFMRRCCKDREWVSSSLKARMETEELSYANVGELHKVVDRIAQVVNKRLIQLISEQYQLMTHLRALKKFMALGQGDFVTCLMDMIGPELSKISTQVYRHDLTGKLEAALRSSNAQYEQPDILNRVGVRLLEASSGEDGWEVFSLDYQVEAPISAIINSMALNTYSRIFHLLWRIKRVEWSLAASWKQHMLVGHIPVRKELPRLCEILQKCNLARRDMVHFVSNLSSFMMFEVLETSWTALKVELAEASDFDGLIAAHDAYLRRITDTSFLSYDKHELHTALQEVLKKILEFCELHYNLCIDAMRDHNERRQFREVIDQRTAAGGWGLSAEEEDNHEADSQARLAGYRQKVLRMTADYEVACETLMDMLQRQEQQSDAVRFLIFRLDFNEFYRTKKEMVIQGRREGEGEKGRRVMMMK